jgi:hypothetical protein
MTPEPLIPGNATEGCVPQTSPGALREGCRVHVVAGVCGSLSPESRHTAIQRMVRKTSALARVSLPGSTSPTGCSYSCQAAGTTSFRVICGVGVLVRAR